MSSISIIGLGHMASVLAARALACGNTVEVIGRDARLLSRANLRS
jgi:8-hydroxy-5-deazaflavin:NADPH oxidoreductase